MQQNNTPYISFEQAVEEIRTKEVLLPLVIGIALIYLAIWGICLIACWLYGKVCCQDIADKPANESVNIQPYHEDSVADNELVARS
jgi:hypothetical protein